MIHERIIKAVARRDKYADMEESGFRDRSLPPYAYTELCPDPDYRPSVMRKRKEGVYGKQIKRTVEVISPDQEGN